MRPFSSTAMPAFLAVMLLSAPAPAAEIAPATGETYRTTPFFDDFDGALLDRQAWEIGTWWEHGGQTSRRQVFVRDGKLQLYLVNDPRDGILSAAVQSREEFLYGTWEVRLRAPDIPGVNAAFYVVDWENTATPALDDGSKQEADLEILTRHRRAEKGLIHTAIHDSDRINAFQEDIPRPELRLGAGFHIWSIEITPEEVVWSVDGEVFSRYDQTTGPVRFDRPYMAKFNLWTGGDWVGGPPPEGEQLLFEIDWIRFTPMAD